MHICGFLLVNNEGASLKRIENGAFNLFSHLMHALLLQIHTDGKKCIKQMCFFFCIALKWLFASTIS